MLTDTVTTLYAAGVPDTMYVAQQLDGSGLNSLGDQVGRIIKTFGAIIVGIVGAVFGIKSLGAAIQAFSHKQMKEGAGQLGRLAIVLILTIVGIGGVFQIADAINPAQGGNNGVTEYVR